VKHSSIPKPTDAELAILRVLWERGPSTVRQVYEVAAANRELVYTTTLKLLQIMTEKGLVTRQEQERTHIYHAAHAEGAMQKKLVNDLLDRAFSGSTAKLVMQVLATKAASGDELREIQALITSYAEKEKNRGSHRKR
jgi:BlaI family transcriptional regulator, penicillinase repressor